MVAITQQEMIETAVMQQRAGSKSLKTTIPEFYVTLLELEKGDALQWTHKQASGGEYVIEIKKAKGKKS